MPLVLLIFILRAFGHVAHANNLVALAVGVGEGRSIVLLQGSIVRLVHVHVDNLAFLNSLDEVELGLKRVLERLRHFRVMRHGS